MVRGRVIYALPANQDLPTAESFFMFYTQEGNTKYYNYPCNTLVIQYNGTRRAVDEIGKLIRRTHPKIRLYREGIDLHIKDNFQDLVVKPTDYIILDEFGPRVMREVFIKMLHKDMQPIKQWEW